MKSNFLNRGAITAGLLALLWSATALAQSAMQPTWVKDGVDWSQYTKYLVKPLVLDDVQLVPPPWAENPAEWKLEVQNPGMVQQLFDDAIRAAIAAGVNITYKILYNDAVAMTGGQAHDGALSPEQITHQLHFEGVSPIYLLSDRPEAYRSREAAEDMAASDDESGDDESKDDSEPDESLPQLLEALLFVADEPVVPSALGRALELTPRQVRRGLDDLAEFFQTTADGEEVQAEARQMEYRAGEQLVILQGSAQLKQGPNSFKSERIEYDTINAVVNAGDEQGRVDVDAPAVHALQHRGQEAGGIVTHDPEQGFNSARRFGYVRDVFTSQSVMDTLPGSLAIGHVRYSTAGSKGNTAIRDVQPFFGEFAMGGAAIAHNGNITNADALRRTGPVDASVTVLSVQSRAGHSPLPRSCPKTSQLLAGSDWIGERW